MIQVGKAAASVSCVLALVGCATESSHSIQVEKVQAAAAPYSGQRVSVAVGRFDNHSNYMRGVFSDGPDRLGDEAKSSLVAHLQQSQRFSVLDRQNMAETSAEARIAGSAQTLHGASYIITGDVSEFGRKEVGDMQLFGLVGRGKKQVAYAKVTLNVVNTLTS
jgi:curli biogenesis system outer membrane secretion channel CsgG